MLNAEIVAIALTELKNMFEILISDHTGDHFYTIMAANEVEAVAIAQQAHLS